MRSKLLSFNTLRNQMLVGFLAVMLLILVIVGAAVFDSASRLLKNNAEKRIGQTVVQASGRLEALQDQIDSLTTQVATDPQVQRLLLDEVNGEPASFSERQALMPIMDQVQAYSNGVQSVELYSRDYMRIYPLDGSGLDDRIESTWIERADEGRGRLVWIGADPLTPDAVLAVRRVSLIDRWFSHGGYLLVRMNREMFDFRAPQGDEATRETMLLVDAATNVIASGRLDVGRPEIEALLRTDEQTVTVGDKDYIMVKQRSPLSQWTLLILVPVHAVTEGISVLRTAIVAAGGIGTLLFALLSFPLSTFITRPILKLIKTMRSARLGVLKPNPETSSTIEINELNRTYNQLVDNMNGLIKLVYEKEILQSRTELKALQAQINPHFLFNTLEAFYWSLQEKGEEELAELVVAMSDLFRYTIGSRSMGEWVTLGEELEHIERYLLIMQMRLGDRLAWTIDTQPEFAGIRLPRLLIQPLVENAIRHGVESKLGPGAVHVTIARAEHPDRLIVSVEDDGPGMDERTLRQVVRALGEDRSPSAKGSGLGIVNVQRRIQLYYEGRQPAAGGLTIVSEAGRGTGIRFEIPTALESVS